MKAIVTVELKEGVLDPQGQAIQQLLFQRGYTQVAGVRVGKKVEIELQLVSEDQGRAIVSEIADRLLANPIIETYRVDIA